MKRLVRTTLATVAFLALSSSPALAQEAQGGGGEGGEKPKAKSYDFSGDTIDGDLVKPDGDFIDTRDFASHTSLIRVRKDFIKEIIKSAEDL